MLAEYRKAVVAVVGLGLLLARNYTGIDFGGMEPLLVDGIISALTAVGVYGIRNQEQPR